MAITKESIINQITILADGQIQVQRADLVLEDGVEIAKTYHRHVLAPGDDLTDQDLRVVAHANTAWTPKVKSDYAIAKAK